MNLAALNPVLANAAARSRSLHILHGVLSLDCGGVERIVVDLTRQALSGGRRVTVICLERPGTLADEIVSLGAEVLCLHKPPGLRRELVDQAASFLRRQRPDVIHTHQIGALWYLGQAARQLSIPTLHTEHSDHVGHAKGWWRKLKTRLMWHRAGRLAARFCCVSEDIARSARRLGTVPSNKVQVVLNGIDVDRYADDCQRAAVRAELKIPADATVLGTVGRLAEVKRQDLLLRAFGSLSVDFPRLNLLLVGDGPERQSLEQLAASLDVRDRVIFAGYQASPQRFLAAMDIFALTSRLEGLPLALLEAWATGLPAVASAVGGIPQVVETGRTGILFPGGDLAALEIALRELLLDPAKRRQLGAAGRDKVRETYSLERMAAEYDACYQRILLKAP